MPAARIDLLAEGILVPVHDKLVLCRIVQASQGFTTPLRKNTDEYG